MIDYHLFSHHNGGTILVLHQHLELLLHMESTHVLDVQKTILCNCRQNCGLFYAQGLHNSFQGLQGLLENKIF